MRTLKCIITALSGLLISTVNARPLIPDSLKLVHLNGLSELLQAENAGVSVSTTDASPGAAAELLVRGISSIRTSQQPLIIVDGVAMISSMDSGINPWNLKYPYTNQSGADKFQDASLDNLYRPLDGSDYQLPVNLLLGLDINTIESISVLKNSSATAIYGSRGANGVIVITTRSPLHAIQRRDVVFSTSVGVSIVGKQLDFLSPAAWSSYHEDLNGVPYHTATPGIDWQKALYSPAVTTTNRLELSGSNSRTSYSFDMMYSLDNGVIEGTKQEQLALSTMVNRRISRIFKGGTSFTLARSAVDLTQTTALLGSQSAIGSIAAIPYEGAVGNPVDFVRDYDDHSSLWRILPRGYLTGNFGQYVSLDINGGVDVLIQERQRWAGNGTEVGLANNGIASIADYDRLNYDVNATLAIKPVSNDRHNLNIRLGGSYFGKRMMQESVQGIDYFNHSLRAEGVKLANQTSKMFHSVLNTQNYGVSADLSYSFKKRYEVRGGLRMDRRIDLDNDFQYYPFIEVGWNLSNETWFRKAIDPKVVSRLSLHGGWGISGMNDLTQYFLGDYFQLCDDPLQIPYQDQLNYRTGLRTNNRQYNVGLDMGFLNNRIRLGVSYYEGEIEDHLSVFHQEAGQWSGQTLNRMKMDKRGAEILVDATPVRRSDWQWSLSASVGIDRVKMLETASGQALAATGANGFTGRGLGGDYVATAFVEGYAPSSFFGFRTDGIVGSQHLPFTPPFEDYRLAEGDIKFVDVNGDGVVDDKDRTIIGSPLPDWIASLSTTLKYKSLTLSLQFDGSYGNDILNLNLLQWGNLAMDRNVLKESRQNAWSMDSPDGKAPAVGAFGFDKISDRMVEDGSYLRLSNVVLAYAIPTGRIKWLSGLEVSFMIRNLFVASPYSGYNPVVNSFAGDWSLRGIDLGGYPYARSFSLGVKIKF